MGGEAQPISSSMSLETTSLWSWVLLAASFPVFVVGGLRFRRWVVEDRAGVPRYSPQVETIFIWMFYSSFVAFVIVILKQMMRRLG